MIRVLSRFVKWLACSGLLLLTACQSPSFSTNQAQSVFSHQFHFADGQTAQEFSLYKPALQADKTVTNVLFVIPGSDCVSMYPMLPDYFRGLEGESGNTQIYILQKRHIHRFARGTHCGQAFTDADHLQQWLADQREFIQQKLALHADQGGQSKRVILLGISEGAETATMLAKELPISHLVLLAHSGKAPLQVYQELAQNSPVMAVAWQQLNFALAQEPAQAPRLIHGRSLRYWREIATMAQTETLVKLAIPVLIAAGGRDPVLPLSTADFLSELNQKSVGRIQILWFKRGDHALSHPERNYLPDFMYLMDKWLEHGQTGFSSGFFALE